MKKIIFILIVFLFLPLISTANYGSGTYGSGVYGTGEVISSDDSSSSGGGGGTTSSIQFDAKILDIATPAILGEPLPFTYFIKGVGRINSDVTIDFWIEKDGEIITSGSDVIFMESNEEKTETASLFLPSNLESGIYKFILKVSLGSISAESHRTIELVIEGGIARISGLFEVDFKLEEITIKNSDELFTIINLENFGSEAIDLELNFIILNVEGDEMYSEKEIISVEKEETIRKSFKNLYLEEGRYTMILQTVYDESIYDEFRQDFEIRKSFVSKLIKNKFVLYILGALIGIIFLSILIYYLKKKSKRIGKGSHAKYKKRIGKNLKKIVN